MESLSLALVLLALLTVHSQSKRTRTLSTRLQLVTAELEAVSSRRSILEEDVRYLKALTRASTLDASIAVWGTDLDSVSVFLRLKDVASPLLLYSIDPDCRACIKNLPFVVELERRQPCRIRVVGVAVDDWQLLDGFRRTHDVTFPILRRASGDIWSIFPLVTSPVLVLIQPQGKVGGWWRGPLSNTTRDEITHQIDRHCQTPPTDGKRPSP